MYLNVTATRTVPGRHLYATGFTKYHRWAFYCHRTISRVLVAQVRLSLPFCYRPSLRKDCQSIGSILLILEILIRLNRVVLIRFSAFRTSISLQSFFITSFTNIICSGVDFQVCGLSDVTNELDLCKRITLYL